MMLGTYTAVTMHTDTYLCELFSVDFAKICTEFQVFKEKSERT